MKHKVYVLKFSDELAYMETIEYETHTERYEKTKDIPLHHIFEPSELDYLLDMIYQINRL